MKKLKFLAMTLCVALCAGFTACGDDDKDENDPIPVPVDRIPANAVYTTKAGNKVVVRDISGNGFTYNTDGLCTQAGVLNIFYSGGLMIDGVTKSQTKFKMNEMGYITEADCVYSLKDTETSMSQETKYRFTYNGDGYLMKITEEGTQSEMNLTTGVDSYMEWTNESTNSWNGGKLIKQSSLQTGETNGEKYRWSQECVIQSGGVENILGQYTDAYSQVMYSSLSDIIPLIGLLGKAPSEFIQSVAVSENYIDSENQGDFTGVMTWNYDFNTNGTIATETRRDFDGNETVWTYSYDILSNSLLAAPARSYVPAKPEMRMHDSWWEMRRARLGSPITPALRHSGAFLRHP